MAAIQLPSGVQSALIQNSGLGANFVRTNPQFSAANWTTNRNHTNYHSMQAQATLRPTHGLSFTTTYTWSRDLGVKGDGTDPLDYGADYGVLGGNRKHALTSYGTYNLPLGGRDSSGWVKRLAEGWQLSWVYSASSGLPYSVTQTLRCGEGPVSIWSVRICSTRKMGTSPGDMKSLVLRRLLTPSDVSAVLTTDGNICRSLIRSAPV